MNFLGAPVRIEGNPRKRRISRTSKSTLQIFNPCLCVRLNTEMSHKKAIIIIITTTAKAVIIYRVLTTVRHGIKNFRDSLEKVGGMNLWLNV